SSRRRHTRSKRDWSSDVCSSDLFSNESPMWQDVISFDNDWLEKQGVYNSEDHEVDETKMRSIVRETMQTMLAAERMQQSAIWTRSEERRVGKECRSR